jgi:hypothetical protein
VSKQRREEQKQDKEQKRAFFEEQRKKTIERLRQYKMVSDLVGISLN